jgi:hypothetical protein
MLYLLLQMPLGILYFTIECVLLALSLGSIAAPFVRIVSKNPTLIRLGEGPAPDWAIVLMPFAGFIILTATMHLVRAIGGLHGRYAKLMLVS